MALNAREDETSVDVGIIGAGFSGLCMAILLQEAGLRSFAVFEQSSNVGGTWRDNVYPGCACDIPSHLYSFSFELNSTWSRAYSPQAEIQRYLEHCTDKYEVRDRIQFSEGVRDATWNEAERRWVVTTTRNRRWRVRYLVSGTGALSRPSVPSLAGAEAFAGPTFHSAEWRHDVDLRDKNVLIVGTGASAIQIVPALASQVKSLHVLQRTAPWILPKLDHRIPRWDAALLRFLPGYMRGRRWAIYLAQELLGLAMTRQGVFSRLLERASRAHLRAHVKDATLLRRLTPDYRIGCKRILLSNEYVPAYSRPNVHLHEFAEFGSFTRSGVRFGSREIALDAVIYCTGFKVTDLPPVRYVGRGGRTLDAAWKDRAEAYYGVCVSNFPNLFLLVGPNTGLGHNSMVFMIESQARFILRAIRKSMLSGEHDVEVEQTAQDTFNASMEQRLGRSVWNSGCSSWYQDRNGYNTTLWPGLSATYWIEMLLRRVPERPRRTDDRH